MRMRTACRYESRRSPRPTLVPAQVEPRHPRPSPASVARSVAYNVLLSPTGRQVVLGLNSGLIAGMAADALTCGRSSVVGSGIGGIPATQAVVDLCAEHGIRPEIEVVGANNVNSVYERLAAANASGVRYVLDAATLTEAAFEQCTAPPAALVPGKPLSVAKSLRGLCALLCCGAGRRGRRGT